MPFFGSARAVHPPVPWRTREGRPPSFCAPGRAQPLGPGLPRSQLSTACGGGGGMGWRSGALGPHAHGNAATEVVHDRRAEMPGQRKPSDDPRNSQHNPQHANYWAPRTHKRHPVQPAQPRYTTDGAPRTRKQHRQEHRPPRPTERSDPTQHAEGRRGDCPGPRKETAAQRNVTQGGWSPPPLNPL